MDTAILFVTKSSDIHKVRAYFVCFRPKYSSKLFAMSRQSVIRLFLTKSIKFPDYRNTLFQTLRSTNILIQKQLNIANWKAFSRFSPRHLSPAFNMCLKYAQNSTEERTLRIRNSVNWGESSQISINVRSIKQKPVVCEKVWHTKNNMEVSTTWDVRLQEWTQSAGWDAAQSCC